MPSHERKVIQIAVVTASSANTFSNLFALCDDGSIWSQHVGVSNVWRRLPQIPKDTEDKE